MNYPVSLPLVLPLLLASLLVCTSFSYAQGLTLYVSPQGDDNWSGHISSPDANDGPFATIERARDEIRALKQQNRFPAGGVKVQLQAGAYELANPFTLAAEDSGEPSSPIIYCAAPGQEIRLIGGRQIPNFTPVIDTTILSRLDEAARGNVLQADLKALGITDFGDVIESGRRLELFFQDKPMTLSRWPNEGFDRIVDLTGGAPHKIHGIPGDKIGKFTYAGERPTRWLEENDLWLEGYWFWDWAEQRQQVEAINIDTHEITLKPPYHTYGYRKGQWFYAFNALSELDSPGEWYLDRQSSILYFWPPAPVEQGHPMLSIIPNLITMTNTSNVTIHGMTLEACRATAITVNGGAENRIEACTIRNTGAWAVTVDGGSYHTVAGCDIYETADGGISMGGGDRNTLTPAGHVAENNNIHHYARWNRVYRPGITMYGCGCRASNNLIHNAPHMAMGFSGNDHVIEYNEIHSVCYESNDAGAIYTGRNWSMRGTVIRYNYLHHINGFEGRGCVGVYLDDQFSGTQIYGNIFYNVTRAAMIGGGRDCTIENNIFIDCNPATHVDSRGLGWASGGYGGLVDSLNQTPYKTPPWSDRYPQLLTLLEDDPMAPKGNIIARNICIGGRWSDFEASAVPLISFSDNLLDENPHFVNPDAFDFQLKDDSPALKLGFQRIPTKLIGLIDNETRASWPVDHSVRPMLTPPPPPPKVDRTNPVVHKIPYSTAPIQVDGVLSDGEWNAAGPSITLEQGFNGEKIQPVSHAWLTWNDTALYIAIDNIVSPAVPVSSTNKWGVDDAVEIAIRNSSAGKDAPIIVLRGFPNGFFDSSAEAGAPQPVVVKAKTGVEFIAQAPQSGRWIAEWRIPFVSLGINPLEQTRFHFNLSVRKSTGELWVEWQGTNGCTWEVNNAGIIELIRE